MSKKQILLWLRFLKSASTVALVCSLLGAFFAALSDYLKRDLGASIWQIGVLFVYSTLFYLLVRIAKYLIRRIEAHPVDRID